jgi:transposase InsO family protein
MPRPDASGSRARAGAARDPPHANAHRRIADIKPVLGHGGPCHGSLKNELVHHHTFQSRAEARTAIFDYIEISYNRQRLYQTPGYLAPAEYERRVGVS